MDLKSIVLPPPRPGSAAELSNPHLSPGHGPLRPYSANALPSITTAPGGWKASLPPSPVHSPNNGQPKESETSQMPATTTVSNGMATINGGVSGGGAPTTNGTTVSSGTSPGQSPVNQTVNTTTSPTHAAPQLPPPATDSFPTLNRKSSTSNFKISKSPPKSLRKAKSMAALGSSLSNYPPPPMPDYEYDDEPASPPAIKTEQLEPATPSIPIISTLPSSTSVSSRRHAHILSEQRRRENINGGFQQLRNAVPYCRGTQLSKAVILKKAVEYIAALEEEVYNLRYRPGPPQGHAPPQAHAHGPPPQHHHQHQAPPMHHMPHQQHPQHQPHGPPPMHLPPGAPGSVAGPPPMHMGVYSSPSPYSYRSGSHSASHLPQPPHHVPERPASAEGSPYTRRSSHQELRSMHSNSTTSLVDDKLPPMNSER
ncbi:hypothetical protein CJU90_0444 [Yarrowia sp. C11]|nr:hypothetical protein CKK34_1855 [Yarrowia sp. E02]KAG5372791.1 hypothetical protein CJU90_0444 [Yarrowia sp. C11]